MERDTRQLQPVPKVLQRRKELHPETLVPPALGGHAVSRCFSSFTCGQLLCNHRLDSARILQRSVPALELGDFEAILSSGLHQPELQAVPPSSASSVPCSTNPDLLI